MKNIFKKTLDTIKYLPIVATAFLAQEIKGQDIWRRSYPLPTEPINLFINQESTPQALEYNALTTKTARDAVLPGKVESDIAGKIVGLVCNKTTVLFTLDSKISDKDIYDSDKLIYDGYDGEDYAEILSRGGTRKYFGTLGIPANWAEIADNHQMNYVITGDNIKDAKSYNFIEAAWPWHATDVKPGEVYIPLNTDYIMAYHTYLYEKDSRKNIANIPVVLFKIVNGEYIFQATNPYVTLITDRESDPPNLKVENAGTPNILKAIATDANLKGIYYSVDGGEKKLLTSGVEINMGLPDGTHTIKVMADDHFRLVSDTTFQRTITTPVNNPPVITFIAPENGKLYDKDISLQYNITDTDVDKVTYRIDNGTKITASQSGTIPLSLADGLHKIVIEATDKKPQTVRDSVSFEMKKATAIEPPTTLDSLMLYPNPAQDIMHIRYKSNMSRNAYRTIYTLDGKPVERKTIGQMTEEDLDITSLKRGMYIMNIVDGTDRQRIKFIKK